MYDSYTDPIYDKGSYTETKATVYLNCPLTFDAEGFCKIWALKAYDNADSVFDGAYRDDLDYSECFYLPTWVSRPLTVARLKMISAGYKNARDVYELDPEVLDGHFIDAFNQLMAVFKPDIELYVEGDGSKARKVYDNDVEETEAYQTVIRNDYDYMVRKKARDMEMRKRDLKKLLGEKGSL